MAKKRKNFIREKRIYCGEEYLEVDIVAVTNMPEAGKGKRGKSSQAQKNLNDKRSKRRFVQIANTNFGTNDFHISATYKGVYGWVNAESIKELSSKAHSDPASVSKGDIVTFTGGGVYKSSTAEYASVQKNVTSTCKVTAVNTKGTHPYHCISQDGKGVYGWVNAADVK